MGEIIFTEGIPNRGCDFPSAPEKISFYNYLWSMAADTSITARAANDNKSAGPSYELAYGGQTGIVYPIFNAVEFFPHIFENAFHDCLWDAEINYDFIAAYPVNTVLTWLNVKVGDLYYIRGTAKLVSLTGSNTDLFASTQIKIDLVDASHDTIIYNYANTTVGVEKWNGVYHHCVRVGCACQTLPKYDGEPEEADVDFILIPIMFESTDYRISGNTISGLYFRDESYSSMYLPVVRPIANDTNYYDFNSFCVAINLAEMCLDNGILTLGTEDSSEEAGPASEEGGYEDGTFDDSSDTIDLPADPLIGVSNVGFVNVYKTGLSSLQNIGVELFPDLQYTPPTAITATDTKDAIVNGFNQIVTFLANIPSFFAQSVAATLINYIIDCHVIPVTPTSGSSEPIKVGYKTLTAYGDRVTSDYVTYPCGSINIGEYYANFADFLTSAKLFLPFVGFVPARPEWFYNDTLSVDYKFNIIDGSFVAYVRSTGKYVNNSNAGGTVIAQYSGNACVHLPITGVTYSNMVSGLVGAGAGAVSSAGSGSISGAATSALNAANIHGDIPQSNAYSSSGSFLSVRRPFLMIERPVSNFSKTYAREIGIPSNISRKLSSVKGFAIVGDVHLDGITATDQEKNELETLLSKGVIF